MLEKLYGLPPKHFVGKMFTIMVASSLATTAAEWGYHKAFNLPINPTLPTDN